MKDQIPGGLADGKPDSDFDPKQLAAGIAVELEHTTSRSVAKEIAKDHLTEDPNYYRKLKKMEKSFASLVARGEELIKAGPYIGPKGGKWADPQHKVAWKEGSPKQKGESRESAPDMHVVTVDGKDVGAVKKTKKGWRPLLGRTRTPAGPTHYPSKEEAIGIVELNATGKKPKATESKVVEVRGTSGAKRWKVQVKGLRGLRGFYKTPEQAERAMKIIEAHASGFDAGRDNPLVHRAVTDKEKRPQKHERMMHPSRGAFATIKKSESYDSIVAHGEMIKAEQLGLFSHKPKAKAGPFIGPRGGKWADAKHTIPWQEGGETKGKQSEKPAEKEKHIYGAALRPISFATVPEGHSAIGSHPEFPHGTVTYDKPLDPARAKRLDLVKIPSEADKKAVAAEAFNEMKDYASEHLEEYRDDPKAFDMAIGHVIDKHNLHMKREDLAPVVAKRLEAHVGKKGASEHDQSDNHREAARGHRLKAATHRSLIGKEGTAAAHIRAEQRNLDAAVAHEKAVTDASRSAKAFEIGKDASLASIHARKDRGQAHSEAAQEHMKAARKHDERGETISTAAGYDAADAHRKASAAHLAASKAPGSQMSDAAEVASSRAKKADALADHEYEVGRHRMASAKHMTEYGIHKKHAAKSEFDSRRLRSKNPDSKKAAKLAEQAKRHESLADTHMKLSVRHASASDGLREWAHPKTAHQWPQSADAVRSESANAHAASEAAYKESSSGTEEGRSTPKVKVPGSAMSVIQTDVIELAADPEGHGLAPEESAAYQLLARSIKGGHLHVPTDPHDAEMVAGLLNDLSNTYDDQAEGKGATGDKKFSRAASKALGAMASKIRMGGTMSKSYDALVKRGEDLQKGGEGSRGGQVVGHGPDGKPIYASRQFAHHALQVHHEDEADRHKEEAKKMAKKRDAAAGKGKDDAAGLHHTKMRAHEEAAALHQKAAGSFLHGKPEAEKHPAAATKASKNLGKSMQESDAMRDDLEKAGGERKTANPLKKSLDHRVEGLPFNLAEAPVTEDLTKSYTHGQTSFGAGELLDEMVDIRQAGANGGMPDEDLKAARERIYAEPEIVVTEAAIGNNNPYGTSH